MVGGLWVALGLARDRDGGVVAGRRRRHHLVGLAWFRRLLGIGPIGPRVAIAGAVLPSAMIGLAGSLEAQLGVLAAVVVGGVLAEPAWERRTRAAAGG
jgi:hypothetical protein